MTQPDTPTFKTRTNAGMTAEEVHRLEQYLIHGASIVQACGLAGVSRSAYYRHTQANPCWADYVNHMKGSLRYGAEVVLRDAILQDKSVTAAQWYLKHRHSDTFNTKGDVEPEGMSQDEKGVRDLLAQMMRKKPSVDDAAINDMKKED